MSQPTLSKRLLALRDKWNALTASEQRTLKLGSVILMPALFYLVLWQPAQTAVIRLQKTVPTLRAQLITMDAQALEMQTLRQATRPSTPEDDEFRKITERAITLAGLNVKLATHSQNELHLSGESVAFARFLGFLRELERKHHIRTTSLTATATTTPGQVKLKAVLNNGAEI